MRARVIIPVLIAVVLSANVASAKTSHRAIYASLVTLLSVVAAGCWISGAVLHYKAPEADTLMTYKREDGASAALLSVGIAMTIPTAIFTIAGSQLFDLRGEKDSDHGISLAPVSGALGLGLQGHF